MEQAKVYRCIENGALWKDINLGEGVPKLYSCGNDYDGEPKLSIKPLEIVYVNQYHEQISFSYQMLSGLQCDCDAI